VISSHSFLSSLHHGRIMNSSTRSQSGRVKVGCLGPGCLVALLIAFFTATVIGYVLFRSVRSAVDYYTTETPLPLQSTPAPQRDVDSVTQKLQALSRAMSDGSAASVTLSKEELAAIPWSEMAPREMRDRVAFSVAGNEIAARFSFRLGDVGSFGVASAVLASRLDRGVEGDAAGTVSIKGRVSDLKLTRLILNGKKFEDVALDGATVWFRGALDSYLKEHAAAAERIRLLDVKNDAVVVEIAPR
jgi:hypothetical protein